MDISIEEVALVRELMEDIDSRVRKICHGNTILAVDEESKIALSILKLASHRAKETKLGM